MNELAFSVVIPIHNEEKNLLYSLPNLFDLDPDEVIFILDSCTDNSKLLIETYAKKIGYKGHLQVIEITEIPRDWMYRVAYLYRLGYRATSNDSILTMAGDIVLDIKMKKIINQFGEDNYKIISFGPKPYPLDYIYFLQRIASIFRPKSAFHGLFLFSKKAWLETESEDDAKTIIKAQDTLTFQSIKKKFSSRHMWTKSLHLRSRVNDSKNYYLRGQVAYQVSKKGTLFMFLSSIFYLRPNMFMGYIHAKRMRTKQVN